ncbi:MAG: type II CAAX endopeptidase family protein [Bacteroidota bacterium]
MFHLSGPNKAPWFTHVFAVVLTILAYILGQIPLLVVIVVKDVAIDDTSAISTAMIEQIGSNLFLALMLIPFVFALVTLLICYKFLFKSEVISALTTRPKLDWKRFFLSFSLWTFLLFGMLVITFFKDGNLVWQFNSSTFLPLLLISLLLIPLQTTAEEVFFRGYLLQVAGFNLKKGIVAVLFTGVLFGVLHGSNPEVQALGKIALLYYISTGIFLGLLAVLDDGLELGMGYHAANNIFASVIVTSEWQVFQTDALVMNKNAAVFGWENYITLFFLQPLLLLLFSKVYRWKSWKSKLLN